MKLIYTPIYISISISDRPDFTQLYQTVDKWKNTECLIGFGGCTINALLFNTAKV